MWDSFCNGKCVKNSNINNSHNNTNNNNNKRVFAISKGKNSIETDECKANQLTILFWLENEQNDREAYFLTYFFVNFSWFWVDLGV